MTGGTLDPVISSHRFPPALQCHTFTRDYRPRFSSSSPFYNSRIHEEFIILPRSWVPVLKLYCIIHFPKNQKKEMSKRKQGCFSSAFSVFSPLQVRSYTFSIFGAYFFRLVHSTVGVAVLLATVSTMLPMDCLGCSFLD